MVKIHRKLTILSTKMIIWQKLKFWKLIFHSYQHISHLSCKFVQFWRKNVIQNSSKIDQFCVQKQLYIGKIWNIIFHSIQQCEKKNWIISNCPPEHWFLTLFYASTLFLYDTRLNFEKKSFSPTLLHNAYPASRNFLALNKNHIA